MWDKVYTAERPELFLKATPGRVVGPGDIPYQRQTVRPKMRKLGDFTDRSFDCALRDSLNTIKETHVQLHLLTGRCATAALLVSQIELYEVLLDEISAVHISLARDIKHARLVPVASDHTGLNA